jgi:hypothetical protein
MTTTPPWRDPEPNELMMFTLYEKPSDYPNAYVVRAWYVRSGTPTPEPAFAAVAFGSAKDAARWMLWNYPDKAWQARKADDEAQIMGVWF